VADWAIKQTVHLAGKERLIMIKTQSRYSVFGVGFLAAALAAMSSGARADLFVPSHSGPGANSVMQFDENDGSLINSAFVAPGTGGLSPQGILWGKDGNLYVGSGSRQILQFDNAGNFLAVFVQGGAELNGPRGMIFGPDGNLYVSSKSTNSVERYNGTDGSYMDDFIPPGTAGLSGPRGIVFGPDGNLYVANFDKGQVLQFDGNSGAPLGLLGDGVFADSGHNTNGICFGLDGNLYVTRGGSDSILQYGGPGKGMDGQLLGYDGLGNFIQPGSGLGDPNGILFGPINDLCPNLGCLYVGDLTSGGVRLYDEGGNYLGFAADQAITGNVTYMTFTMTDPVTLQYK
jgi:WD40 repeat protein